MNRSRRFFDNHYDDKHNMWDNNSNMYYWRKKRLEKEEAKKKRKAYLREKILIPFELRYVPDTYTFAFHPWCEHENTHMLKNYGVFPDRVLHLVFQFLSPYELPDAMATCKLFHSVLSTSLFWKEYFQIVFGSGHLGVTILRSQLRSANWRTIFIARYRHSNEFYSTKYEYYKLTKQTKIVTRSFQITVLGEGGGGVGKSTLIRKLFLDDDGNYSEKKEIVARRLFAKGPKKKKKEEDTYLLKLFPGRRDDYGESDCILICYSVNSKRSFGIAVERFETLKNLDTYKYDYSPFPNIILVGLRSDLRSVSSSSSSSSEQQSVERSDVFEYLSAQELSAREEEGKKLIVKNWKGNYLYASERYMNWKTEKKYKKVHCFLECSSTRGWNIGALRGLIIDLSLERRKILGM